MAVYQISLMKIKPGRMQDFIDHQEAVREINERFGLKSRRLIRAGLAGPDVGLVQIISEFEDVVAHATWTHERAKDPEYKEWRKSTPGADPDSPGTLLSTALYSDIVPPHYAPSSES
ncbi:MAG TPA: hypothetical protein VFQ54_01040 [Thermomicrobiales bacterium]|nr:hypothetical protein [Thermomicrobiales bacterium]